MGERRAVKKIAKAKAVVEGAGVRLRRAFGFQDPYEFDPFLLLADFRSDATADFIKGFPWHPHRGIETITYVTRGRVAHEDSIGNSGTIGAGDVQWMTAGGGIYHQEMPEGDADGAMYGFQLWANLPAASKMMSPRYREILASDIPVVRRGSGTEIKVIAGTVSGVSGPVKDVVIEPEYLDVSTGPGAEFVHPTKKGSTVFAYVYEGSGSVEGEGDRIAVANRDLVLFGDGDEAALRAGESGMKFLLISGMPIREQIAWYGPIVMNTEEELQTAYDELRRGDFIKTKQ